MNILFDGWLKGNWKCKQKMWLNNKKCDHLTPTVKMCNTG